MSKSVSVPKSGEPHERARVCASGAVERKVERRTPPKPGNVIIGDVRTCIDFRDVLVFDIFDACHR